MSNQPRHVLGLLPLPVLNGESAGVRGSVKHERYLPLTPTLSPRQERGEGAARCVLHRLRINFSGTRYSVVSVTSRVKEQSP
jgi:hypothetical protein